MLASLDDSVVLVTVVGARQAKPGQDFLPLTVDYQEKTYAAGRIPGGFFKREGRPSEKETLTSRLIDRPIRPLFPDGFYNEVQVIATVMSVDPEIDPDVPAMIGASAAIALSGVPFNGPIGCARVGYIDGQYVLNPTKTELTTSGLDLVVAGTEAAVLMVESEAKELPEEVMLGAVVYGHQQQQAVIELIHQLVEEAGKPLWDWQPPAKDEALIAKVADAAEADLRAAYAMRQKQARQQRLKEISAKVESDASRPTRLPIRRITSATCCSTSKSKIVRNQILSGEARIDGRDTRTVRPISIRTSVLPRTHGSALFTRGRDAGDGRRDAGHRSRRADHRRACRASTANASCSTTTCLPMRPARPGAWVARSGARSVTGASPSGRSSQFCRPARNSPIRSASSRKSPSRTVVRRWPRSAARASR